MARLAIFQRKVGGLKVNVYVSRLGAEGFEAARARLATLAKWPVESVGNADVVEFLSRGEKATKAHLAAHPVKQPGYKAHGTLACYTNLKCRCALCKAARAAEHRRRSKA